MAKRSFGKSGTRKKVLSITHHGILFAAVGIAFSLNLASAAVDSREPITMCDLAKDPQKYENQRVRLKAEYAVGSHGAAFFDRSCPVVVLGGYEWANRGCPAKPSSPAEISDMEPIVWAGELFRKRQEAGRNPSIEVVISADVSVASVPFDSPFQKTPTPRSGFCHMGASPFKLAIKTIEAIVYSEKGPR